MAIITPTTKLEAVNRILGSIGQAPVNTLSVSGIGDVADAIRDLDEVTRDVLTTGWSWNTDEDYPLAPDVNGIIAIPGGTLDVDPTDPRVNATVRRMIDGTMALYDFDTHSFTFSAPVLCRIIWGFEFEALPQAARTYIATAAGRRFQARKVSSPILDRFGEKDEERSWILLQRRERAQRDTNAFRANPTLRRFFARRRFT